MEKFQRYLERDRDIGYSFSLADILRAVNMVFHELEPKWGVIPNTGRDVGQTVLHLLLRLAADGDGQVRDARLHHGARHLLRKDHKGDNIRRIIERCKEFIAANPMEKAEFKLAGGLIGVLAAANDELVRNDLLMNFLGFCTMFVIVLFTYRSAMAGVLLLLPLFLLEHRRSTG